MAGRLNGKLIRRLRSERRPEPLSLRALAEKAEVTPQQLSNIETGTAGASLETAARIAEALGVSLDFLMTDDPADAAKANAR